ncbi:protein-methionine sulfoxide oxidase mical2b isoform X2 [Betta splendens]|nr:protein-methionine sulfoxide oxidase mical2b isoform X2 [Betta splendens]
MVALKVPDRLSILTYVSQYYNYFHGRSPIGGMGGIKRPAEGPADASPGKKNQPVVATLVPPPKPARQNSPPPPSSGPRPAPRRPLNATQDAVLERPQQSGTLSNLCVACDQHVHLVQRHLVDGKLYHRNCAKLQASTNSTSPLRPLPTNTPNVSKWTPPADPARTATPSSSWAPSRLASEKQGTASTFCSSFSTSPPSRPPAGSPSTTKEGRSAFMPKPQTTGGTTFTTTTHASTRPASATAERTQQAKLKFLQPENTTNNEEKKTSSISVDVKGPKGTSRVQEAKADLGPAPAPAVGGGRKPSPSGGEKAKAAAVGAKQADNEANKAKAKASAAAFISKKLTEENNNNNRPAWTNVALKKTDKAEAPVETPRRDAGFGTGRVKLKVDPSILADLQPVDRPAGPAAADRGGFRPGSAAPAHTSSGSETPADWRSKLKPVAKDAKPVGPSQPLKPWAGTTGPAQTPAPSSVLPVSKGLQNGQKDRTANGTRSNASKTKPDYIPKDVMMKELQEIEDNLNELEKRGVELEMKLRKSEEEGEDDSLMDELMVEWFGLIRNKQVAVRRESELNYIGRTQELEEEQPSVEQELRRLMDKPECVKTQLDRMREDQLMKKLMDIVNDRNAIVEGLDEDRLREEEEDEQLNKMMMDFNIKKEKTKKKSPMAKLFNWGNKKEG